MADKDSQLDQLVSRFEASEQASADSRKLSERDRDYFNGKQWTRAERKIIEDRGQPVVTINKIRSKINFVAGAEIQTRTRPKALPRNPGDADAAHAATDAIRFVCDNNDYDRHRSKGRQDLGIEGTEAMEVSVKPSKTGFDVTVRRIPWNRFYYDPHSAEDDFSDAQYVGEVIWMDLKDAKARFPGKEDALNDTMGTASPEDTFGDKPSSKVWADKKRERVRVASQNFLEKGQWKTAIFTKGGLLTDVQDIPFVDEDGQSLNHIIAQSLYVDRENDRHGIVRDMISPQQEINKRRSKLLHLVSVRQARRSPGAGDDKEQTRAELARPDGIIDAEPGDFEILNTNDQAIGQIQLLQESKQDIEGVGPNATLQGKQEKSLSGRAIQATQQGGMVELAPYLDAGDFLDLRVYRQIFNRIQQYWSEEKTIRVTDDPNSVKFISLNRPITFGEAFGEQLKSQDLPPDQVQKQMARAEQDPRFNAVVSIQNNVADLGVDIVIEKGPDLPTIEAEEFEKLVSMVNAGIPIPPAVVIEASSLRNKKEIIDSLKGAGEDVDPQQQQLQQVAVQLELEEKATDIAKTKSETLLNQARASDAIVGRD